MKVRAMVGFVSVYQDQYPEKFVEIVESGPAKGCVLIDGYSDVIDGKIVHRTRASLSPHNDSCQHLHCDDCTKECHDYGDVEI